MDGEQGGPGTGPWWRGDEARRLVGDAAVVAGLAGVAITQPVLDLFGQNPTFFVAGNYGRRTTVAFALVVATVPAALTMAVTAPARLAGRQAARVAHGSGVAVLATLLGLVACRSLGIGAALPAVGLSLAVGAGVAVAEARLPLARRFLTYMVIGNVAFVGLFLLSSPTAELLRGTVALDAGTVRFPDLAGPVTVVVLDEFPLASILRPDGTINEVRYPNLAALADESTWFRNASAEVATTFLSVPEILTGVRSDGYDLPTHRDHPRSLLTLFGARYPVNAYQVVTDLCPPDRCGRPPAGPLRQALSDAGVVYRHRLLPDSLRDGLPPVDHGWGDFGGDVAEPAHTPPATVSSGEADPMARLDQMPEGDAGRTGQAAALRRFVRTIGGAPSVNLVHVLLPHHPYELTPWGVTSRNRLVPATMPGPGAPDHQRAFAELYGMQAMQVAAVDQLVGEVVAELRRAGAWDSGTFVLVSDHGIDITPPHFTRKLDTGRADGILRIPLFIRVPGQQRGEVRDEPASTFDVLPSLVDVLDVGTDWRMDGHSLFDGSEPTARRALGNVSFEDGLDYVARQQAHLPPGDGWDAVLGIGPQGDLVGRPLADVVVGTPSALTWSYARSEELANPAGSGGVAPVRLVGTVGGTVDRPPELVVALDGVISGTIGGYVPGDDGRWRFSGLVGPEVAGGAARVEAYAVERTGPGGRMVTLHGLRRAGS